MDAQSRVIGGVGMREHETDQLFAGTGWGTASARYPSVHTDSTSRHQYETLNACVSTKRSQTRHDSTERKPDDVKLRVSSNYSVDDFDERVRQSHRIGQTDE